MSALEQSAPPAGGDGEGELPIEGYGELTVARVLPRIEGLNRSQLWRLHEYERQHANRVAVLAAIERALD